jgi:hypothetical protein
MSLLGVLAFVLSVELACSTAGSPLASAFFEDAHFPQKKGAGHLAALLFHTASFSG